MSYQHQNLAAGRWATMSFLEQMANVGSEVERALNWRSKNNQPFTQNAFDRALELLDLTLQNGGSFPRLKEVARVREGLVDYFSGSNEYLSTDLVWKKYFLQFNLALRRDH